MVSCHYREILWLEHRRMPISNLTPCEAPRKIPVTFVQLATLVPTAPPPATLVPKTLPPATLDPVAPQPATQDPTAPQPATLVPAVPPPDTLASATPQLATLVPTARSPATLVPRALQTATRGVCDEILLQICSFLANEVVDSSPTLEFDFTL